MKKIILSLIAVTTLVFSRTVVSGQTLTIKVSDSLLPLNQKWAEAYAAKHPTAVIHVSGEGTSAVFGSLAEKKADLAVVSRGIRYQEVQACEAALGRRPAEFKATVSGVAVYVNAGNPVKILTCDELASIYQGQSPNWKEFDVHLDQAISVYAPATNSVCGELFNEEVLDGRGFSPQVQLLAGQDMLKTIAANPNSIGIGPLEPAAGVQTVSVKQARSSTPVNPTEDNIAHRIYPISRYVFCYLSPAASPAETTNYVDWIRSDEGQQIARAAGFYELPPVWRSRP